MLKTIDRYVFREMVPPFLVGLLLVVFVLLMNQVLLLAELFIDKGVPAGEALRILGLLLPSILAFAVPMAVLTGILGGLARLSADSEVVAFQTLGIGPRRLARPVLLFAVCGWLVTSLLALFIAPRANHRWVRAMTDSVLARVRLKVHPLEFNESIPNMVFLVRDIGGDGAWEDVFARLGRDPLEPRLVMARRGRIRLVPETKRAVLELSDGVLYAGPPAEPEKDSVTAFERLEEDIPVESLFASISSVKRVREKDIGELVRDLRGLRTSADPGAGRERTFHLIEIHKKFSLPFVCLIFVLLGLPLGLRTGRAGRTGGYSLSLVIILLFYMLLTAGEKLAADGKIGPPLGMWGPDLILAVAGLFLFLRSGREPAGSPWPPRLRTRTKRPAAPARPRPGRGGRIPSLPFPNLLDRYVIRKALAILGLVLPGLLGAAALALFFERLDDVLRLGKPVGLLASYVGFKIPGLLAFILPVSVLAMTLLALGLLARSNEATAVKACGVSLRRLTLPVLVLAAAASGAAFLVQERIAPAADARAEAAWGRVTGLPPRSASYINRHWILGREGDRIYHYDYFDPAGSTLSRLTVYDLDLERWSLTRRTFAERAVLADGGLRLQGGWTRDYSGAGPSAFRRRESAEIRTGEESAAFLKARREPPQMTLGELRRYVAEVRAMGFRATRLRVDLGQKTALPFVSLVMALLAVPFAFSMGRKGALVGAGLSVALAMAYWGAFAIFRSLGTTGVLPPFLAAWGANLIFGLAGAAGLFRLRT
jgi:LPS export ABC transporter permease LptF/LPS export ABC transporter permease LptG